jgi:hypothetical protein
MTPFARGVTLFGLHVTLFGRHATPHVTLPVTPCVDNRRMDSGRVGDLTP